MMHMLRYTKPPKTWYKKKKESCIHWKSSTRRWIQCQWLQRQIPGPWKAHRSCSLIRQINFNYNTFPSDTGLRGSLVHVMLQCRAFMQQNGRSQINKPAEDNFLSSATAALWNQIHYLITLEKVTGRPGRIPLTASL